MSLPASGATTPYSLPIEVGTQLLPEGDCCCRIEIVLRNPQPSSHPGGNWDLGGEGSLLIDEFSLSLRPAAGERFSDLCVELSREQGAVTARESISVKQFSSGGENWQSKNHLNQHGKVDLVQKGYEVEIDGEKSTGLRASPICHVTLGDEVVSVYLRDFWECFPSSLEVTPDGVTVGLLPSDAGLTELQGGEQKTFEVVVEQRSRSSTSSIQDHLALSVDPANVDDRLQSILKFLKPRGEQSDSRYESLVDLAIEGDDSFFAKREKIDEFGWRHFGDVWGDHEAVYHRGDTPMISHYNNQYDCTLGFGIQYLRTRDPRWLELMLPMADHAWDIDTYHTNQDKLLYNGGLFWHTYHYADAHTAAHRSYPRQLRVSQSFDGGTDLEELGETGDKLAKTYQVGGGPAAAHNYSTGWMLAYCLTGKERYKEAAINAADYVMRIDDGAQTPFRWLSRSDTGYSTCSSEGYYGPGRASGNSTHALLTGHELTGERKYLDRAALLMRRTVHPNQDLDALDLLNAELRWFYTMYLQALARFVDYKLTLGETDDDFRYGVASLRHYARWMAAHERPTLDEPEKLQYPTETWAAQDMRKWQVLEHAARYESDSTYREKMWEKAEYFYNYCVDYLNESPTKTLCRPVVLMLNFGWQRPWYLQHRDQLAFDQPIEDDFGQPVEFVPQRTIAIRRFKQLVVAGGLVGVLFVVLLLLWLLQG
ncbi:hypothetical protein LOC67_12970 [Stieleria sp. JC731]|uniref:hypothetical protein n=1 Tax=Pirellulaceae TaxID=2691357 RepID=UPI001E3B8F5C|nr:hypothetical protein [Stieleria sp. JC731]MCC9601461.1 hypothetical protein [Stieleria sp. JC731]